MEYMKSYKQSLDVIIVVIDNWYSRNADDLNTYISIN